MSYKKLIRRPGANGKSIALAFEGAPPSVGRVATVPVTEGGQGRAYAAHLVQAWNHYDTLLMALNEIKSIKDLTCDEEIKLAKIFELVDDTRREVGEA